MDFWWEMGENERKWGRVNEKRKQIFSLLSGGCRHSPNYSFFFLVKLHFYPQTFWKLQNSPKIFYVLQKHPHIEDSRGDLKGSNPSFKNYKIVLQLLGIYIFFPKVWFLFNLVIWPLLTLKIIIKITFPISQNILHHTLFTSKFHL